MSGTGVAAVEAAVVEVPAVVETPTGIAADPAVVEVVPAVKPAVPGWVQPRIDTLTREKDELRRKAEEAEAKAAASEAALQALRNPDGAAPVDPNAVRNAGVKMISLEEAERLASIRASNMRFAEKTQDVYLAGKKQYKEEFDTALANLRNVGFGDNAASRALVEAAMETGKAPEVLHALAQDLSEAGSVLQLGPTQMGVRLASLAAKVSTKPGVSNTPEPVPSRVSGASPVPKSLYDADSMSTEDWIAQRNKTARKRKR